MKHYIGIIGAVKEEIAGIKQRMRIRERHTLEHAALWVGEWQGYSIVLVRSGMGRDRACRALKEVAERYPLVLLLSIGYAGGLDPDLDVGDMVIADTVLDFEPGAGDSENAALRKFPLSSAMVNQALILSCPADTLMIRGTLVTVDQVVATPKEKQALRERSQASAVDMETSELAREAEDRAIPFLSIRSITDTVSQELMDCSHLVEADGEVSTLKAGWHVLTHPGDLKSMIELRTHAQKATANLTEFLLQFLKNYK